MKDRKPFFELRNFKLKDFWNIFLIAAIPIICVGGASFFPYMLRPYLIYFVGFLFCFIFVFTGAKVSYNIVTVSFLLFLAYIGISYFFSLDTKNTLNFFIIYLCSTALLFLDIPKTTYSKILTVMFVICSVIAFSIIISAVINNCMETYFWFIVNPTKNPETFLAIREELAMGAFSGFAREKAEASYVMNVGIAIIFSRYFSKGKFEKKELFFALVFFAALMLTGKRMMFIIPLICFFLFILISEIKGKAFKVISIIGVSAFLVIFIIMFIPQMANIFLRFMDTDNISNAGSRDTLWQYIFMMISKYWLFGGGFGSYNQFAYDNGLRVYSKRWDYNAHNSYFQIFGEVGVIGSVFLLLFVASSLILTLKLIKSLNKESRDMLELLYFSMYIQIMIIIYSVTGNPLYTKQMIFIWLFSVGISLYISRKIKQERGLQTNG